jgi:hypothetical protein
MRGAIQLDPGDLSEFFTQDYTVFSRRHLHISGLCAHDAARRASIADHVCASCVGIFYSPQHSDKTRHSLSG